MCWENFNKIKQVPKQIQAFNKFKFGFYGVTERKKLGYLERFYKSRQALDDISVNKEQQRKVYRDSCYEL
jgi:hypothetical protein